MSSGQTEWASSLDASAEYAATIAERVMTARGWTAEQRAAWEVLHEKALSGAIGFAWTSFDDDVPAYWRSMVEGMDRAAKVSGAPLGSAELAAAYRAAWVTVTGTQAHAQASAPSTIVAGTVAASAADVGAAVVDTANTARLFGRSIAGAARSASSGTAVKVGGALVVLTVLGGLFAGVRRRVGG